MRVHTKQEAMEEARLIVAVLLRQPIYDETHPKHRNRDAVRSMCQGTAEELGVDEDKLKFM